MSDLLDELSSVEIGGIQTDHGGITLGDILVLILDFVLLIYTAWRSYDFLTTTVPDGWQMLALIGLWGLDIGAVFWSLTWIFGSTGKFQNWVSVSLFLIDLAGVGLTGLTDSLMYGDKGAMVDALGGVTRVAVPVVMFLNVLAGFIYHMTSPQTKERRKQRELQAEHNDRMRLVREAQMKLAFTQAQLLARQETVELAQVMAQIKVAQDQIEQSARKQLRDSRMANVQGQLSLLTGFPAPLQTAPADHQDDLAALQEQIGVLNDRLTHSTRPISPTVHKPALQKPDLSFLGNLKHRILGTKPGDGVAEDDLTDMQEQLRQKLEELEQTRQLVEQAKANIDQPIQVSVAIPSHAENHPQAGSNGGHPANPTTAS